MFIGAAVYPTLAMFNHSCDPSIVRFYVEDVVCVQVTITCTVTIHIHLSSHILLYRSYLATS